MKKYEPEALVKISRYQNYFPTLVPELQRNVYRRMKYLIEEEKEYCNYTKNNNYNQKYL